MLSLLKKWTTAGVAAAALAVTFGLATAVDDAQARPAHMKAAAAQIGANNEAELEKRLGPQKRVSAARMRRILRKAKPLGPAGAKLAQKRTPPPPPGAPGSFASKKPSGGGVLEGGISCSLGLCFCSGAAHCNVLIAACVEVGGTLDCTEHDSEGRPTGCSCFK